MRRAEVVACLLAACGLPGGRTLAVDASPPLDARGAPPPSALPGADDLASDRGAEPSDGPIEGEANVADSERAAGPPPVAAPAYPLVTIGKLVARGDMSSAIIRRTLARRLGALADCCRRETARRGRSFSATALVRFTIDANAIATDVHVRVAGRPGLAACVARTIRGLQFPMSDGGGVVFVGTTIAFHELRGP